jgi:Family of unknown function (DUF5335)
MQTLEIQPARWSRALAEFSSVHEGWLISLDILSPAIGAQPEVRDLPLVGIVAEPEHRGSLITISAAKSGGEQITHSIHSATRVRLERTDAGADVAMQIESAEGTTTILRLRTPALPETVDGLPKR